MKSKPVLELDRRMAGSRHEAGQQPFCYLTKRKHAVLCDNTSKKRENAPKRIGIGYKVKGIISNWGDFREDSKDLATT